MIIIKDIHNTGTMGDVLSIVSKKGKVCLARLSDKEDSMKKIALSSVKTEKIEKIVFDCITHNPSAVKSHDAELILKMLTPSNSESFYSTYHGFEAPTTKPLEKTSINLGNAVLSWGKKALNYGKKFWSEDSSEDSVSKINDLFINQGRTICFFSNQNELSTEGKNILTTMTLICISPPPVSNSIFQFKSTSDPYLYVGVDLCTQNSQYKDMLKSVFVNPDAFCLLGSLDEQTISVAEL